MLPAISMTTPALTRCNLACLVLAALLTGAVPTFRAGAGTADEPAATSAEGRQGTLPLEIRPAAQQAEATGAGAGQQEDARRGVRAPNVQARQVQRAIERGVAFLRSQQKDGGGCWPDFVGQRGGVTALCTLALLRSGARPADEAMGQALGHVRSYKLERTYTVAIQTMVLCAVGADKDVELVRRNVRWLEKTQLRQGPRAGAWSYPNGQGDNSNTHFALLALHEADLAGVSASQETWRSAQEHWIKSQNQDGSWGYYSPLAGTGSMTCAGLASLAITAQRAKEKAGVDAASRAVQRGQKWLRDNFAIEQCPGTRARTWTLYYLHALQHAGRLTGQERFGEHDWRRQGVWFLVNLQDDRQGSWKAWGHAEDDPVIATSLALLFLAPGGETKPASK